MKIYALLAIDKAGRAHFFGMFTRLLRATERLRGLARDPVMKHTFESYKVIFGVPDADTWNVWFYNKRGGRLK